MEIFQCEQGSDEWFAARLGIPTSSEFHTVLAQGKGLTRATYMRKLVGEIITGEPAFNYVSADMERGKEMEAQARTFYELATDATLTRVGFIRSGRVGCSPDSLIGADGMVEFKTAYPHVLVELLDRDQIPSEHKAQCQGGLWVCEREWIDLFVYWPKMIPFKKRVHRDESYIRELSRAVDTFNADLQELLHRTQRRGAPAPDQVAA